MKKVGLALGSGGAKGLCHIGVLQELIKNDIHIDYISGCSAGAIVGAYYAIHQEIDGLLDKISHMTNRDWLKLVRISDPRKSIIASTKLFDFFSELIGDYKFSDTKIPIAIVATDMATGKEVVFKKGKLIDAIKASASLPGIFVPMKIKGKCYLDGGIVNPTPVDIAKDMGADFVIGVDLTMRKPVKIVNPNIIDTLLRSFEILRTKTTKLKLDLIEDKIVIHIPKKNVFETYKVTDNNFVNDGVLATKKAMPEIKIMFEQY